jgi:hypothetical protein
MNRTGAGVLALLFILPPAASGGGPKPGDSPAKRLAAIQKEYKAAEDAFYKAAAAVPDTPEGRKQFTEMYKPYDKGQAERFQAALELARADPKSDAGFAALEWILTNPRAYSQPAGKPALELLTEHHAANPRVGKVVAWVGYFRPQRGEAQAAATALIKAVTEKNPDRAARGQAVLALALEVKGKFAVAEFKGAADVDRLASEAEKAFEALLKEYADCPRLIREDAGTLGDLARAELFELRNLRVGKVAPDIEGEDLDGVKFKLSDYRGKVIVLDFWGDW